MLKIQNSKQYELEDRSYLFAKNCRNFVNCVSKTIANLEYSKQLIRSSGSQAANYIEANEAISKKDFIHRIKISRKEAKESRLWLRLFDIDGNDKLDKKQKDLIQEAMELTKIFGAILSKSE